MILEKTQMMLRKAICLVRFLHLLHSTRKYNPVSVVTLKNMILALAVVAENLYFVVIQTPQVNPQPIQLVNLLVSQYSLLFY